MHIHSVVNESAVWWRMVVEIIVNLGPLDLQTDAYLQSDTLLTVLHGQESFFFDLFVIAFSVVIIDRDRRSPCRSCRPRVFTTALSRTKIWLVGYIKTPPTQWLRLLVVLNL